MTTEERHTVRGGRYWKAKNDLYNFLSRRPVMIGLTIGPVFLLLGFILFLPIAWAVVGSFFNIHTFNPQWEFVFIENYIAFLTDTAFWETVGRSIVFAGGSVLIQLVAGIGIALVINRSFKFISMIRALVLLPYLIPTVIVAYMGLWIGNTQWGILNIGLMEFGLVNEPISWFGDSSIALLSVIMVNSWKFSIFVAIMVLARLQSIPDTYYEAAIMSGATAYQRFRDITLPNLKSIIFIVLLLRGVWMFNKFDIIWVTTRGGPGESTTTAPIYAYRTAFFEYSLGRAAAISTFLFALLAVTAIIYFVTLNPAEEVRVE